MQFQSKLFQIQTIKFSYSLVKFIFKQIHLILHHANTDSFGAIIIQFLMTQIPSYTCSNLRVANAVVTSLHMYKTEVEEEEGPYIFPTKFSFLFSLCLVFLALKLLNKTERVIY